MTPLSPGELTPKQLKVLRAVGRARFNQDRAAAALGMTRRAVDFHLVEIRRRLDVNQTAEAWFVAVERGLIDPPAELLLELERRPRRARARRAPATAPLWDDAA